MELDHQNWLGHDLREIACEKAGIMRNLKPVVVGPVGPAARQCILDQARAVGADVVLYGRDFHAYHDMKATNLHYKGRKWDIKKLTPGLKGRFQLDNAACALAALESLAAAGMKISRRDAQRGIESARWPGRFERTGDSPTFIVDAAHNRAAVRALTDSLGEKTDTVWLISALSDKDLMGMALEMLRISSRFVLIPLDHPRGMTVEEMEGKMPEGCHIQKVSDIRQGISVARKLAGKDGRVVVAGSVVLAGEVLKVLGEDQFGV